MPAQVADVAEVRLRRPRPLLALERKHHRHDVRADPREGVEVLGEKIGEIKGAGLLVVQGVEARRAGEDLVAVRAR